jgi:hypothetical protein
MKRSARQLSFIALGVLMSCSHGSANAKTTRAPSAQVIFASAAGELKVEVEVARTEPEQRRGLMFRQKLAAGHGMLFPYAHPQKLSFWMKNTYIPLDMIFIDGNKRVAYIEENAEPLTLKPRGPDGPTQFVLEVPGGWSRAHGVGPGLAVRFVGVD